MAFPWDKWTIFLHPEQRQLVEREFAGPARISGSAGTGKTIVAIHRAAFLARANNDARVLLTTFSDTLANDLAMRLNRVVSNQPRLRDRIDVQSICAVGLRIAKAHGVTCPILQLHGTVDSIVPISSARQLFAAAPERSSSGVPKRFVPLDGADDNNVLDIAGFEVAVAVREFLQGMKKRFRRPR